RNVGTGRAGGVPRRLPRRGRSDAAPLRRGGDAAAADRVRAREGRVRAPLRARQPARLGSDPGRRDSPTPGEGVQRMSLQDLDLHLIGEGRHERLYEKLGAHVVDAGVRFAVWAPNATGVSVVGDFNDWDGRADRLTQVGVSGVWEGVVESAKHGDCYKYELHPRGGGLALRADPVAFAAAVPPKTASRVYESRYEWRDDEWLERRRASLPHSEPMSVYEVHLGSWRIGASYRESAEQLAT